MTILLTPTKWISVEERLPGRNDGITQLWMKGTSLADLVLGCHSTMQIDGQEIKGVLNFNNPNGLWDLCDFTHWIPLPEPPDAPKL